jgi:hypothetical protein
VLTAPRPVKVCQPAEDLAELFRRLVECSWQDGGREAHR